MVTLRVLTCATAFFTSTALHAFASGVPSGNKAPTTRCSVAVDDAPTLLSAEELLGENTKLLSASQLELVTALVAEGQSSLFESWPAPGEQDEGKQRLLTSLERCDSSYTGGLVAYLGKARELLEESAAGTNPFEGFTPTVPDGETLEWGTEAFTKAEAAGLEAARGVGFVLVAGGLGERLGYEGIKLELPVEAATGKSYLELYCNFISSVQSRIREKKGDSERVVPLAIMTSDDTDAPTRALMAEMNNFGLEKVSIMKQDKVAALADGNALLALDSKDRWELLTKPHGHGDVHSLMRTSGVANDWLENLKLSHVFFFQDTNALVLNSVLPALGVSVQRGFAMNSVCVPRRAAEAAGAISYLKHADPSKELVINVEYNQLDPLLKANGEGDVNDPATGFSPFPGNANVLVIDLKSYSQVLEGADKGVVDEFVNPKYADAEKCKFKKPTRLECMMQDYPKLLAREIPGAKVGFSTFQRWLAFSPAKNALEEARQLASKSEPPGCSASAEFDVYAAHARRLGMEATEVTFELAGVESLYAGPRVVLSPSFALTKKDVADKVLNVKIADKALLVLDGANIVVKNLEVKPGSALFVENSRSDATLTVDGAVIENGGLDFIALTEAELKAAGPIERVRGYTTKAAADVTRVVITAPGNYVLGPDGLKKLNDEL